MRARSILNRRAQTTGSTHNFEEIVQMCAKNFAHIKKTRRFRREQTIFNELLTASEDEGLLARKGIERRRQAPRTISKKLCKCVQKTLHTLKKHDVFRRVF